MKRKTCLGFAIVSGMMVYIPGVMAAPTVAQCKTVYSSVTCAEYSLSSVETFDGGTLYICSCTNCPENYAVDSSAPSGGYKNYGGYSFYNPSACGQHSDGGGNTPSYCAMQGGVRCTDCYGPNYTINGVKYCGIYESGTKTCTGPGGAVAGLIMGSCCKDNKAVSSEGCFVMTCQTGMVVAPNKRACVCDVGYYGDYQSCTRCPALDGFNGLTAGSGAKVITDCFIPAGVSLKDTVGNYVFTEDCKYQN